VIVESCSRKSPWAKQKRSGVGSLFSAKWLVNESEWEQQEPRASPAEQGASRMGREEGADHTI